MKANEIIIEAFIDPGIRNILQQKGYKFLGSGIDQTAYLAPDGTVLKIFGTSSSLTTGELNMFKAMGWQSGGSDSGQRPEQSEITLTKAQKTFKAFADYCLAHPDNQFLPQFSDWATFEFKGKTYLQIKMERLFSFDNVRGWAHILSYLADAAERSKSPQAKNRFVNNVLNQYSRFISPDNLQELISHLGEEGFNKLWDTIYDLGRVAKKLGLSNLDLHSDNFMLGSDGEIVISDPFFVGNESYE